MSLMKSLPLALFLCGAFLCGVAISGCAATNAALSSSTTAATQSLGIKDGLVQLALQTARNYLGRTQGAAQGAAATPAGAPPAATPAVAKAKEQGQSLTSQQETGLTSIIKGLL